MLGFQQTLRRPGIWQCVTLALAAALVVVACGPTTLPGADSPPIVTDTTTIDVNIANRATTSTREDLRATQGDTVSLRFTSDEAGEVHLHGYDLTTPVSPDQPGSLTFEATNAGSFGLNFHVYASASLDVDADSHDKAADSGDDRHNDSHDNDNHAGDSHSGDAHTGDNDDRKVIAEAHLGNLEIYPR